MERIEPITPAPANPPMDAKAQAAAPTAAKNPQTLAEESAREVLLKRAAYRAASKQEDEAYAAYMAEQNAEEKAVKQQVYKQAIQATRRANDQYTEAEHRAKGNFQAFVGFQQGTYKTFGEFLGVIEIQMEHERVARETQTPLGAAHKNFAAAEKQADEATKIFLAKREAVAVAEQEYAAVNDELQRTPFSQQNSLVNQFAATQKKVEAVKEEMEQARAEAKAKIGVAAEQRAALQTMIDQEYAPTPHLKALEPGLNRVPSLDERVKLADEKKNSSSLGSSAAADQAHNTTAKLHTVDVPEAKQSGFKFTWKHALIVAAIVAVALAVGGGTFGLAYVGIIPVLFTPPVIAGLSFLATGLGAMVVQATAATAVTGAIGTGVALAAPAIKGLFTSREEARAEQNKETGQER